MGQLTRTAVSNMIAYIFHKNHSKVTVPAADPGALADPINSTELLPLSTFAQSEIKTTLFTIIS